MGVLADSRLRFGVFGLCHWHAEYYRDILAGDFLRIAAATDGDAEAGRRRAERWDIPFENDFEDMIARHRPDFLFVLPRHDRAADDIRRAAATGLPMLVEKPFGRDGVEARRAAEAVEAAGVFADSCLPNRHMDIWTACRDEGGLPDGPEDGRLLYAHFRTNNGPGRRYLDYGVPWMLEKRLSGGGALRNLGYHGADAALSLARGGDISIAGAVVQALPGTDIEGYAAAALRLADGAVITLEAGYATPGDACIDHEWRLSTASMFLSQQNGRLLVQGRREAAPRLVAENEPRFFYVRMVTESVRALVEGRPPNAPVPEAARAAELIDAIYAHAEGGHASRFPGTSGRSGPSPP